MISTCFLSPFYLSQSHPSNITIPLSLLHIEGNGVYIQKQFVAAFSLLFITYKYTSEQKFCHLSCIWFIYRGTVTVKFIWNFQSKEPTKQVLEETDGGNTSSKIGMGPVFSSLAMSEEGVGEEGTLEAIHACAREGDLQGLSQLLDLGIPVDLKGEV
jgi:hypothetical protein